MSRKKKTSLLGALKASIHRATARERSRAGMNAETDQSQDWCTPPWLLAEIVRIAAAPIDLDPCGCQGTNNLRTPFCWTAREDGLRQSWSNRAEAERPPRPEDPTRPPRRIRVVYCNPPYKDAPAWIEKAKAETAGDPELRVFMLLPAFTDQPGYEVALLACGQEWSVKGRVRFLRPDGSVATSPRFPSTIFGFGDVGSDASGRARLVLRGVIGKRGRG